MPSEFHNREPPLPFGNPKGRPWYRYGYFLESPNSASGFQVMGMIEWARAKSQDPKKSLGLPAKHQKIPGPKIHPQKIPCQFRGP